MIPVFSLPSTPPQTLQFAQLVIGTPRGGGGPASTTTESSIADASELVAGEPELSEQPTATLAADATSA